MTMWSAFSTTWRARSAQSIPPLMAIMAASRPARPRSQPRSTRFRRTITGPVWLASARGSERGKSRERLPSKRPIICRARRCPENASTRSYARIGVENRLHWRLDVVMNEDQDRTRMDNGPHNLAVLRHMALNVMQKDTSKGSLRAKFMRAGWDERYLARLLALF